MTINWVDDYSVHVKLIDEQHKIFIGLMDKVTDSFYNQQSDAIIEEIFQELFKYMDYHFKTEEDYFDKFKFEGAYSHIAEHRKFSEDITKMYEEAKKDKMQTTVKLIDYMEDWLIHHIDVIDKQYTKCFNDNGLF